MTRFRVAGADRIRFREVGREIMRQQNNLLAWAMVLATSGSAFAEAPLFVDDAGVMDVGGKKMEALWRRDRNARGGEITFGVAPLRALEIGFTMAGDRDHKAGMRGQNSVLGLKWVPVQQDVGWSFGAVAGFGRLQVTQEKVPGKQKETDLALTGLATWQSTLGQALHLNLGVTRARLSGGHLSDAVAWGIACEQPAGEKTKWLAEIHGDSRTAPDRAIGVRWLAMEGFKLSALIGRGNGRHFGQIGLAREF